MAEEADKVEDVDKPEAGDHLPGLSTFKGWVKILWMFLVLVLINVMAAITSWGWGVIITIPFTAWLFFLLLRDMLPRHRFPPGRQPPMAPT